MPQHDTTPRSTSEIDRSVSLKKNRKWLRVLPFALGAAGLTALQLSFDVPHAKSSEPETLPTVTVAPVAQGPSHLLHRYFGVVDAEQTSLLGFEIAGRVSTRVAQVGDAVEVGQVLALLEPHAYSHRLRAARGQVQQLRTRAEQLQRELERAQMLYEREAMSRQKYEQVRTEKKALDASLQSATAQASQSTDELRDTKLCAPFSGIITDVFISEGDIVSAGAPAFRLVNPQQQQVIVEVSEAVASQAGPTTRVRVRTGAERALSARIVGVSRAANARGLFPVRVAPQQADSEVADLRTGTAVEIEIHLPADPSLLVPTSAIVGPAKASPWAYRLDDDGRVSRQALTLLGLYEGQARVKATMKPGDNVVVSGHAGLLRETHAQRTDTR